MNDPARPTTSADSSAPAPGALIDVLERQHALVSELAVLAERQAQLIERAATDELLALLTRRQTLIDSFTGSQEELNALTGTGDLAAVPAAERARIEALIDDIGRRLAEVMERDERDQQSLEAARGRTRRDLSALDSARTARRAYVAAPATSNRFADERG